MLKTCSFILLYWPRSSAWIEQQSPKLKVVGSNPTGVVEGLLGNPLIFLLTGRLLFFDLLEKGQSKFSRAFFKRLFLKKKRSAFPNPTGVAFLFCFSVYNGSFSSFAYFFVFLGWVVFKSGFFSFGV